MLELRRMSEGGLPYTPSLPGILKERRISLASPSTLHKLNKNQNILSPARSKFGPPQSQQQNLDGVRFRPTSKDVVNIQ